MAQTTKRRQLVGRVIRDRMDKTAVVMTERRVQHPKYKKYYMLRKKYKAHNHENRARYGDLVVIEECRRLSKEKRWSIRGILEKASGVAASQAAS